MVVAVLLAAGAGSRFREAGQDVGHEAGQDAGFEASAPATHKLDGRLPATSTEPESTVFERSLRHLVEAGIGPIVIVCGAWSPPADVPAAITVVDNPQWADGQITSVRAGLAAADRLGATRAVFGLTDQPFVVADAWRTVATGPGPICVATYGARRGNPVALDRAVWDLLAHTGDEGARALMRIRPDLVREVACAGSPTDIDTAEDLRRWQNS